MSKFYKKHIIFVQINYLLIIKIMIFSRIKNVLNNYKFMFMNNHKNFSEIKYMMIKKSLFDQNNNDEILKSKKNNQNWKDVSTSKNK